MLKLPVLPLLTGLVPLIAVHATYLVSAIQGYVPWCFVYLESCSSISATGRYGASFYIFKGLMIPAAMIMMLYWLVTYRWLLALGDRRGMGSAIIPVFGSMASIFLIVYVLALGAGTEYFYIQRRIGVIIFFTFTFMAQLLLTYRLRKVLSFDKTRNYQSAICYSILLLGISTLILDAVLARYEDYEDAFEWGMSLLIQIYFLVTAVTWYATDFRVDFTINKHFSATTINRNEETQ